MDTTRFIRSRFATFHVEDFEQLDALEFLQGHLKFQRSPRVMVMSLLDFSYTPVPLELLQSLLAFSDSEWTDAESSKVPQSHIEQLLEMRLLISDSDQAELAEARRLEESLRRQRWSPKAAAYHFATQHEERGDDRAFDAEAMKRSASENARKFVENHGAPPPHFHKRVGETRSLPEPEGPNRFQEILLKRKTVRAFDLQKPMQASTLSTLLHYTFGCHGVFSPTEGWSQLRKTSPSGGGMHPVEVYPLVFHVEGLEPGLFHYDVESHSLVNIRRYSLAEAQELAVRGCRGQTYAGSVHVLFLLTARWGRNFWKYPLSSRTYSVILKDVGHLSQTLYLLAADLDLGAFYTGAVCSPTWNEVLGVNPIEEGALGAIGCGPRLDAGDELDVPFEPYDPGTRDGTQG